jgi:hypothetical protein
MPKVSFWSQPYDLCSIFFIPLADWPVRAPASTFCDLISLLAFDFISRHTQTLERSWPVWLFVRAFNLALALFAFVQVIDSPRSPLCGLFRIRHFAD